MVYVFICCFYHFYHKNDKNDKKLTQKNAGRTYPAFFFDCLLVALCHAVSALTLLNNEVKIIVKLSIMDNVAVVRQHIMHNVA